MPEITIWYCDWCGKKYDDGQSGLPPTGKGWTLDLDPMFPIRRGTSRNVEMIHLFPKPMRTFTEDSREEHILCPECITALQDAVKNVREVQISKREKK